MILSILGYKLFYINYYYFVLKFLKHIALFILCFNKNTKKLKNYIIYDMDNNSNVNSKFIREDEIDLKELFHAVLNGKWLIASTAILFSVIGILYSLSLPNIYQSTALLYPTEQQSNGLGGAMKAYSGLAGLAGINLSSQSSDSNSVKALEKVTSLSFFAENLMPNIFLPDLMAVDSWDKDTNLLIYDEDIYNETSKIWVRDFKYPQTQVPSAQKVSKFL